MNETLLKNLLVIGGVIVILLIVALIIRKTYHVQREIVIKAPLEKVFDYVRNLKNQDNFNKWVMVDPSMRKDFRGTDGTAGFIYSWNGNKKAGEGEQEIKTIVEGKNIETEIRFIRPFTAVASVKLTTESLSGNQTKVTWSNTSAMKYPLNIMVSMIEKMLSKDMDESLNNLKTILEK